MKVRIVVWVLSLIMLFALIGIGTGCSESDSDSVESDLNGVVSMMEDIPEGISSFAYYDLKAMRGDSDLEGLYNDIRNDYLTETVMYNMDFADVNYLADCEGKELVIFKGEFNTGDIRNALEDNDYTAVGYREEEVWLNNGAAIMVALLTDTVAIGDKVDIEEYMRVKKEEVDSLLDSEDPREIIDKLPGGIAVYYSEGTGFGSEALATSYKKKDGNTTSITNVFRFVDADKAEEVKNGIGELFTLTTDYKDVSVKRDGKFIILTALLDINDMIQ